MQRSPRFLLPGLPLLALLLIGAGCTSSITNLTPTAIPRNPTGLYHFETQWTSNQRSRELRRDLIRAYVVVDEQAHFMEPVARMPDRWESDVPIPEGKSVVYYHYKWDYATAGFNRNVPNSLRSQAYRLEILDPAP